VARQSPVQAALILFAFWFPVIWMLYTSDGFEALAFPWWKALLSSVYVVAGVALLVGELSRQDPRHRAARTTEAPLTAPVHERATTPTAS